MDVPGQYKVTYTATDSSGNENDPEVGEYERTVLVLDKENPCLSLPYRKAILVSPQQRTPLSLSLRVACNTMMIQDNRKIMERRRLQHHYPAISHSLGKRCTGWCEYL